MEPILIIILISIVGRGSAISRKTSLNLLNESEPLLTSWFIYLFSFIFLTIYLMIKQNNPVNVISSRNINWIKWTLIAAIFSVVYSIIATPLLKQLNYSLFSALKSPISLIVAILGSIIVLQEKPSKYIYFGVFLYLLAAFVSNLDLIYK